MTPGVAAGERPDAASSLASWLTWLEAIHPREIELGLERVAAVLGRLDLPRPRRVITVAGTNGKGSTVAYLEGLFRASGARTAAYTSPHVSRYNERLRVDRRELDDAAIVDALAKVDAARGDVSLTYFEFGTLAAFVAFADADADVWILEVGLGGRLDAVNALDADGVVITGIGLDHCDWLGDDLESIAREKAGVMRKGIPVVFAAAERPAAIDQVAAERGAQLLAAGEAYSYDETGDGWCFQDAPGKSVEFAPLPLAGHYQLANAAGALALFRALEGKDALSAADVDAAWQQVALPGRLQSLTHGHCRWLLDVAHNGQAAAALADELERRGEQDVVAVIGAMRDKDVESIVECLAPYVARWTAVTADAARALPAVELASRIAAFTGRPCRIEASIPDGLAAAADYADRRPLRLVTGSFYVVGPALAWLGPDASS